MIVASRFYRVVYKPILLRINKFTWNKFYVEALGNISALEALNASKPIILNDILHFLGPIGFEKIMSVSNKLINLLLGGSVVSYLVLNSWTLFLVVVLNRRAVYVNSNCSSYKDSCFYKYDLSLFYITGVQRMNL